MAKYVFQLLRLPQKANRVPPQKLNDAIPELKQATDKESRTGENGHRGSFTGRGRGGRGGFAARGFASAGLTRGGAPGRMNGDGPSDGPKPSDS